MLQISFQLTNLEICLKQRLNCDIPDNFQMTLTYILSFLTFLDLDVEKDRERAFWTFEKLRNYHGEPFEYHLKKYGISFMEDGYKNLR